VRYSNLQQLIALQGTHAGSVSTSGGYPFLEVGPYQFVPEDKTFTRNVVAMRSEPLSVQFGSGMTLAWYQAMAQATDSQKTGAPLSGEVVTTDLNGNIKGRLIFTDARIVELGLPAVSAQSTEQGVLTATFQPTTSSYDANAGGPARPPTNSKARRFSTNSFRLRIQNAETATEFAVSIDALTFKMSPPGTVAPPPPREGVREKEKPVPVPPIQISNLVFRVPLQRAQPLITWFNDFVQQPTQNMRPGILEYSDATRAVVIASVTFERLGILRCGPSAMIDERLQQPLIEVEAYCEGATVNLAGMA